MMAVPPPKLDRSLTLHFRGDWGRANLHRALGWLGYELLTLAGPQTRFAIWNGRGGYDNVAAVGHGEVDLALATPASFMPMAIGGKGPCGHETFPHIRALGHVPQHDRLVVALRRDLGIRSFAELREKRPGLRITLGPDDGVSFMGVGAQLLLAAHGLPRAELERWGCSFIEYEEPHLCTSAMRDGKADMIVQEAIMTDYWQELADKTNRTCVPSEES